MELEDGTYEVMVIEAREEDDGAVQLDLVVSSGPRRGAVASLGARGLRRSWHELLGTPCTLIVEAGQPRLRFPSGRE
jgi:hypothetical protein